jgi:hypothetical protein
MRCPICYSSDVNWDIEFKRNVLKCVCNCGVEWEIIRKKGD